MSEGMTVLSDHNEKIICDDFFIVIYKSIINIISQTAIF